MGNKSQVENENGNAKKPGQAIPDYRLSMGGRTWGAAKSRQRA